MSPGKIKEAVSKYVPFPVVAVLAFFLFYSSILLWIIFLPLTFLYSFGLSVVAWTVLPKHGIDVVAASNGDTPYEPWTSQILPLIETRAWFLDYQEYKRWPRWSLKVLLFGAFGPWAMPAFFVTHSLPCVIVVKKFRRPRLFTFGVHSKNKDDNLQELRSILGDTPTNRTISA